MVLVDKAKHHRPVYFAVDRPMPLFCTDCVATVATGMLARIRHTDDKSSTASGFRAPSAASQIEIAAFDVVACRCFSNTG